MPRPYDLDRVRQWLALIEATARDFGFRLPPKKVSFEEAEAYLRALTEHVDARDLARGFELRVGTPQAAWTPEMVDAFKTFMTGRPRRDPEHFQHSVNLFKVATLKVVGPIDDAALRHFVDAVMEHMVALRTEAPAAELPLLVGGLTTDAELLTTTVDRGDRIAFVTALARNRPLFGWFVASDMFIHSISTGPTKSASKQDAIGVHFGTRGSRGFLVQPYTVREGAVRLLPKREDLFQSSEHVDDPYAFIFAPPTSGAVS